jgi:phosphatidylserine/phosphatidylglycerophosphate/cardiolipin synthase-like enzyme
MTIRKLYFAIIFSVLFLFLSFQICFSSELTLNNTPVQVYFSPFGGCTQAIVKEIGNAKNQILIQAYSFTSKPIAKALLEAHKRGVKVEAIVDKSQRVQNYSSATFLANSRVPTFIDDAHDIAHNKIIIIDGQTVITGSFNFTKAAEEKNAENVLIIKSPELVKLYVANWMNHREHSEPYAPRN